MESNQNPHADREDLTPGGRHGRPGGVILRDLRGGGGHQLHAAHLRDFTSGAEGWAGSLQF